METGFATRLDESRHPAVRATLCVSSSAEGPASVQAWQPRCPLRASRGHYCTEHWCHCYCLCLSPCLRCDVSIDAKF
eukprot:907704-Amphidinium_carterae.1